MSATRGKVPGTATQVIWTASFSVWGLERSGPGNALAGQHGPLRNIDATSAVTSPTT